MGTLNGVHHVAFMTSDIKVQLDFFTDVLGMELVALYWMHNVASTWHGFLKLNDSCSLAFVQTPAVKDIPQEIGKTHAGNPTKPCAAGVMQHLAFNVDTEEQLLQMRDRIRSRNVPVLGPLDHGFAKSIYFAGPEMLTLEVSMSEQGINPQAWIDPEVVEQAGISAADLQRYRNPAPYENSGSPLPPVPLDAGGPTYAGMEGGFKDIWTLPDQVVLEEASDNIPPVAVD